MSQHVMHVGLQQFQYTHMLISAFALQRVMQIQPHALENFLKLLLCSKVRQAGQTLPNATCMFLQLERLWAAGNRGQAGAMFDKL